jgi:hypothetical protein
MLILFGPCRPGDCRRAPAAQSPPGRRRVPAEHHCPIRGSRHFDRGCPAAGALSEALPGHGGQQRRAGKPRPGGADVSRGNAPGRGPRCSPPGPPACLALAAWDGASTRMIASATSTAAAEPATQVTITRARRPSRENMLPPHRWARSGGPLAASATSCPDSACSARSTGRRAALVSARARRPALGRAGAAGQLFGANDVAVTRVQRQRLRPPAAGALPLADTDLPHRRPRPLSARRMSAHRFRGAGGVGRRGPGAGADPPAGRPAAAGCCGRWEAARRCPRTARCHCKAGSIPARGETPRRGPPCDRLRPRAGGEDVAGI